MKGKRFVCLVIFLGIWWMVDGPLVRAQTKLTLLYTNNINGEIDPCPS
jgi:hypothetical protein